MAMGFDGNDLMLHIAGFAWVFALAGFALGFSPALFRPKAI
jgi:hypothetical protein